MPKSCLTLLCSPLVEEKLLDLLLDEINEEVFTSVPTFSHGMAHGRLSSVERVMGRSQAIQVQILVSDDERARLLPLLRERFVGTGLRYWLSPVAEEGEIQ